MEAYESCKAAAQLASHGKGSGAEDTISLDVHSINQLKVCCLYLNDFMLLCFVTFAAFGRCH